MPHAAETLADSPLRRVLAPPLQFQDPAPTVLVKYAERVVRRLLKDAVIVSGAATWSIPCSRVCHLIGTLPPPAASMRANHTSRLRLCWTPDMYPCHSRLSASHNSLSVPIDDSSFISSAISHDVLLSDEYAVPVENDVYAVPINDPNYLKTPPYNQTNGYNSNSSSNNNNNRLRIYERRRKTRKENNNSLSSRQKIKENDSKARSASAGCSTSEPIHLTLQEVRQYLQNLYTANNNNNNIIMHNNNKKKNGITEAEDSANNSKQLNETFKKLRNPFKGFVVNGEVHNNNNYYCKTPRESSDVNANSNSNTYINKKSAKSFPSAIKQTLCNLFRFRKYTNQNGSGGRSEGPTRAIRRYRSSDEIGARLSGHPNPPSPITKAPAPSAVIQRALPPLPPAKTPPTLCTAAADTGGGEQQQSIMDFAASIQKVKDYGWYWGPISGEAAERILSNEPDGSFIVRDSSDDYYIFSLTFKLNSIIRHVRIEHDQGNFSFGNTTRFKSHTIVDFIESAVEHSRSGRYLFFLHRRPVLGPMRVQLLHPVSRFKQVQSLQHMCRFVIMKYVRRDLVDGLPLPRRLLDYLSTPHYYAEHVIEDDYGGSTEPSTDHSDPPSNTSSPWPRPSVTAPLSS